MPAVSRFRQIAAAVRAVLVLTAVLGLAYPLLITLLARTPGLSGQADGSLIRRDGAVVGSALLGQNFTSADGTPLRQYLQSRPSAAGYDPLASGASNLGPEDVVDPVGPVDSTRTSLLTQVCARSLAVGRLESVDGRRPYCTDDGVGAVLAVFRRDGLTGPATRVVSLNQACPATPFLATYQGVRVECARPGQDYSGGVVTAVRGDAPARPVVPADAVTASGSGLDPAISTAYARLQAARVAAARGVTPGQVLAVIEANTTGRTLGVAGEPAVNVLTANLELDRRFPVR